MYNVFYIWSDKMLVRIAYVFKTFLDFANRIRLEPKTNCLAVRCAPGGKNDALATVNKALNHLEQLAIVRELTSKKRNRLFIYVKYFEILNQGIRAET
jgi:hypothetical protein